MKIGYARVSTVGQDIETQKEILQEAGCEKIFVEKVTGTSTAERTQLKEAMEFIREGDVLVVTKIDRLARSIMDLNKIIKTLAAENVSVHFIKDNMYFEAGIEVNSMQTLMFNILGSFAQFERDLIVERTTEGRERAKKQGKHMGRPGHDQKSINRALMMYDQREVNGMSVADIVRATGIPRSTLYAKLKER
ncbi:recombinase family protein [Halobacillus litoralis]|uniref:Recombinase family protein n=1 Tax=Halobacillus litoralis TaxID=45668 RepID=A0A845E8Q6_9BACI|nr:recombinase family protein [Halobacillus litoralis]MYL22034.1 recombinase family protein [Halobacillus litoralis]